MSYCFTIAARSLFYRKKQYLSLFLVCLLGIGISLCALFLMNGMMSALKTKAQIYYGGDLQFIGGKTELHFKDTPALLAELQDIFPAQATVSARFEYTALQAGLYFEGTSVRQRVIKGVDFQKEASLFSKLNYESGGIETMHASNGILLSAPIALQLHVAVGDEITLMLRTLQGYINTVELEVKGIFKDSSMFGMYTSYMDINCLLASCGEDKNVTNRICVYGNGRAFSESDIARFQSQLEERFTMFPLVKDKQLFYDDLLSGVFEKPTYALVPLEANLQDVQVLIHAMRFISFFVITMLVVIIVAGIGSTYRVLVMKRSNEIGIYMALGMKKHAILALLLFEALLLLVLGGCTGTVFALGLCKFLATVNFSFIPAFDIFLTDGFLQPLPSILSTCNLLAVVLFFTMLAVLNSVLKSIRVMPVQALAVTE